MDSGLLAQIQKGKALKKAQTNDRSAPVISAPKSSSGPLGGMARPPIPGMGAPPAPPGMSHKSSAPPAAAAASASVPAGPQLGGLFANGMPSLRKTRGAAVNTGRGSSSSPPPPPPPTGSAPPPPPGRSPAFSNKPPAVSNTLPRNFKAPPPIPGRAPPIPSFNAPAPPPPPPPSAPSAPASFGGGAAPPPPPPPPPPPSGGFVAPGVSPRTQAALVPPVPGRSRSNSSPQRPVPPPPPKAMPSPPSPPRVAPRFGLPNRPSVLPPAPPSNLAVPPALPPGRPRSSSTSSQQSPIRPSANTPSPLGAPPPPPPPPPPSTMNGNASPRGHSPVPTPPRSPLPPPPPSTHNRPFGTAARPPVLNNAPRTPQVPLTEGGGRYTFRPTSDLPPPRQIQPGKKYRVYPSGESKGNGYPLDYSKLR